MPRLGTPAFILVALAGCGGPQPAGDQQPPPQQSRSAATKPPPQEPPLPADARILVVENQGLAAGDLKRVREAVAARWLADRPHREVDEPTYTGQLTKYEGHEVVRMQATLAYGKFQLALRSSRLVRVAGELVEEPLPDRPEVLIPGQESIDRLLQEIRFHRHTPLDLKIELRVPRLVFLHRTVEGKITVTNAASQPATDVGLVATIPPELEFISSTPRGTLRPARSGQPARLIWTLSAVPPGGQVTIEVNLRARARGKSECVVRAPGTTAEAQGKVQVIGVPAMHISTYDTEDPVEVGKETVYVIELRNEGTSPCTNIRLVDDIPEQCEYVSAEGPTKASVEGRRVTFAACPILQPGEKLTYRIKCRALSTGSGKNTAGLKYDQCERVILDEEGTSLYD